MDSPDLEGLDSKMYPSNSPIENNHFRSPVTWRPTRKRRNCLSIEELLNPDQENEVTDTNITDEEIFEAVRAKRTALDGSEINEGDDDNDDAEIIKKQDRQEALAASLTLQRYVSDIGDPFARQLDAILASFGRHTLLEETQSLQPVPYYWLFRSKSLYNGLNRSYNTLWCGLMRLTTENSSQKQPLLQHMLCSNP